MSHDFRISIVVSNQMAGPAFAFCQSHRTKADLPGSRLLEVIYLQPDPVYVSLLSQSLFYIFLSLSKQDDTNGQ